MKSSAVYVPREAQSAAGHGLAGGRRRQLGGRKMYVVAMWVRLHNLGDNVVLGLTKERCTSACGRKGEAIVGKISFLTYLHIL